MRVNSTLGAAVGLVLASVAGAQTHGDSVSAVARKNKVETYYEPMSRGCTGTAHGAEVTKVAIKSDLYKAGSMISPDSAKSIALCHVPGQVTSGEMASDGKKTVYAVTLIPNKKKTHSKVIIDAATGQVLSVKQFGGARGFAGWIRESGERKNNKMKAKGQP